MTLDSYHSKDTLPGKKEMSPKSYSAFLTMVLKQLDVHTYQNSHA